MSTSHDELLSHVNRSEVFSDEEKRLFSEILPALPEKTIAQLNAQIGSFNDNYATKKKTVLENLNKRMVEYTNKIESISDLSADKKQEYLQKGQKFMQMMQKLING